MPVDTQIGVVVTHMLHQQRNTGGGTALKGGEEEGGRGSGHLSQKIQPIATFPLLSDAISSSL